MLFERSVTRCLKELGYAHIVRSAKKMIESQESVVWDLLQEIPKALLDASPLHMESLGFGVEGEELERLHQRKIVEGLEVESSLPVPPGGVRVVSEIV